MKKLNVTWLPETFAVVALTISADRSAEICAVPPNESEFNTRFQSSAPGKLIIISDGREPRVNVATLQ